MNITAWWQYLKNDYHMSKPIFCGMEYNLGNSSSLLTRSAEAYAEKELGMVLDGK